MHIKDSVIIKIGAQQGHTVAVFCGIHGNETAGILAVRSILDTIEIARGKVYFVFANPRAIEQGIRFTEKNLNRCFLKNNQGDTYEDNRARVLMKILDESCALLDLHASNIPDSTPFLICEKNAFDITKKLDFEIVSTGWDAVEPGATDGYMFQQNKVGICVECGFASDGEKYAGLAQDTILHFLAFYNLIDYSTEPPFDREQRHLHVDQAIIKKRGDFVLTKNYADFETLPAGTCYARDGEGEHCVEEEAVILFANPQKEIGGEACILGHWEK